MWLPQWPGKAKGSLSAKGPHRKAGNWLPPNDGCVRAPKVAPPSSLVCAYEGHWGESQDAKNSLTTCSHWGTIMTKQD